MLAIVTKRLTEFLSETIGRVRGFWLTIYSCLIFVILLLFCISIWVTYVNILLFVIVVVGYNQVLWTYAPEKYPSYMRATAVGVHNGIGKWGGAVGTFVAEYLASSTEGIMYTLYTFIVISLVACVASMFLKMKDETKDAVLVDSRAGTATMMSYGAIGGEDNVQSES